MSRVKISIGFFAAVAVASTTTSAPMAGETLSNGAYVCNPAHSYPAGASCDGTGATPTLVYPSTSTVSSKPETTSSVYVCNPAHSYPAGASCDGSGPTPTLVYTSTVAAPSAGQTLSNGGYVCNPAHSYPGATCDGQVATPTLSYYPTTSAIVTTTATAAPSAGQTLSNGGYVCNPAHSYPGATCDGQAATPTLSYYPTTKSTASPVVPSAGQTLSDGGYVCNPAHSYPGATCNGQVATPTLSYYPTTKATTTSVVVPPVGQTLSNGGYVCNPAHSYPGATCDGQAATPTLSYYPTTKPVTTSSAAPSAGQTLSNGGYVCNPAHSYPGATCNGQVATPTLSYYPTSSNVAPKSTTLVTSVVKTTSADSKTFVATTVKSSVAVTTAKSSPVGTTGTIIKSTGCPAPITTTVTVGAGQPVSTTVPSPKTSGKSCPLTLAGTEYQYPHLIVTSSDGKKTSGTLYNATISSKTTSFFNFDIPQSYAGKTCDVVFSLPRQDQLETSSFHLGGSNGVLDFSSLASPIAANADVPKLSSSAKLGSWLPVPGYHYAVSSGPCAAGRAVGYSISAEGDRALDYFQDYNPCPIGLYVIAH